MQTPSPTLPSRGPALLRDFILELGYGFCFVGRQHRIALGKKEYFIDLLLLKTALAHLKGAGKIPLQNFG